jgi:hypothetical protein
MNDAYKNARNMIGVYKVLQHFTKHLFWSFFQMQSVLKAEIKLGFAAKVHRIMDG